jgi:hypothetical protein
MTINELAEIGKIINDIEAQIDSNSKELMAQIYAAFEKLRDEVTDVIELGDFNNIQFSLKFFKNEIIVTYMDDFAFPIFDIRYFENVKPTFKKIVSENDIRKIYSGCISFYCCNPSFNIDDLIYLDRFFINEDFDIAVQSYDRYTTFEKKENILNNLEKILTNTLSELFTNFIYS